MNYTINQLAIFLKVVETKSITKAAEELYMTQPAVSIQLKNFQNQFDIPLTEVIGRNLHITDFGIEVAELAEKVIEDLNEIQFKTSEYQGILTGRLKISSASTGKYVMPYFLSGFLEQHPGIDLTLDVTNKTRVMESLKNNEIDFALVSVLPDNLEYEEEKLIENRLYLVSHENKKNKHAPLIYREKGSATRAAMEDYFKKEKKKKRKSLELTSNEAVKQAVMAGLGQSIIPLIGIKNELLEKQLFIIEIKDLPIKTDWRLIWLKDKKLSPVAQAYLNYLREEKSEILKSKFEWYQSIVTPKNKN